MYSLIHIFILIGVFSSSVIECSKNNKYSAEANIGFKDAIPSVPYSTLDKPFRMGKINKLWSKAQIHGLSEQKLASLYGELTLLDKQELTLKTIKMEGKDKKEIGIKEEEMRTKFRDIINKYGLRNFEGILISNKSEEDPLYNEANDKQTGKAMFKDKKLNKLWASAENAGFSTLELEVLQEEFNHHQDKIDKYYELLSEVKEGPSDQHENSIDEKLEQFNTITSEEPHNKDYIDRVNLVRDNHRDLRDSFDRLNRLSAKGPNSKEFVEPKVQGLWKIALESNFTAAELESLRIELLHYEKRLFKLRHFQAEMATNEKHRDKMVHDKSDHIAMIEDNIRKQARKVDKIHLDLETRIMQKHVEL